MKREEKGGRELQTMSTSNSARKQGSGRARREELAGSTLRGGEYQIKRVIGHGGMGKVFLASHITLETPLALKQCRADQPLPESVALELEQLLHALRLIPLILHRDRIQ